MKVWFTSQWKPDYPGCYTLVPFALFFEFKPLPRFTLTYLNFTLGIDFF